MRNLTFSELHSLIQNEQSFGLLGRFWADNLLSVSALTNEQRASLYDAWTARRILLADLLAERSHTRKAA